MPDAEITEFSPGRYVMSWVGAGGARDPIALSQQVKMLRDGFKRAGHDAALILVVVADGEEGPAAALISDALNAQPVVSPVSEIAGPFGDATCPDCGGSGDYANVAPCPRCEGSGTVPGLRRGEGTSP